MKQNEMQININPEDTSPVACKCGSEVFMQGFTLRRLSAIISPTGKEEVFTIPLMLCASCGEPLMTDSNIGGIQ